MSENFKTVAQFGMAAEAHMLKGRLEAEGLSVFIADEETVSVAWHFGQAVGGIKVQVSLEDLPKAKEIYDSLDLGGLEEGQEPQSSRARRAMLAAIWGILLPPLQLYSIWLALRLIFAEEALERESKTRLSIALFLDLYVIAWILALIFMFSA
jgi:hypothetical protein